MERREFIKNACLVCGQIVIAQSLESCVAIKTVEAQVSENKTLIVPKTIFFDKEKSYQFVKIHTSKLPYDFVLYQDSPNTYKAFYLRCSHRDSTLTPTAKSLNCSEHGSRFDLTGKVLNGPAEKNLKVYAVLEKGENLEIILS